MAQKGPRAPRLTRHDVLRAALRLVDASGLASLTMRRLAEELRVTPMALYNHVEDKDALLVGLVDLVAGEIRPPDRGAPWAERLSHCAREIRCVYLAHPRVVPLFLTTSRMSPSLLRPMEEVLAALRDGASIPREPCKRGRP